MPRYTAKHHTRPAAWAIAAVIGLGYTIRTVEMTLLRNRQRAREHWAYAVGAFTGRAVVGGRVVTGR